MYSGGTLMADKTCPRFRDSEIFEALDKCIVNIGYSASDDWEQKKLFWF